MHWKNSSTSEVWKIYINNGIIPSVKAKSVDIQQLPALDQRSSFADASAASNSIQPPAVQPLSYGRQRVKTKYIERRNRDNVRYVYRYRGRDVAY